MEREERRIREEINKKPTKHLLLVYADWLDEVDEDRAEAIRVLVQNNQLPVQKHDKTEWGRFGVWRSTFCEALDVWIDLWLRKEEGEN